MNIPLQLASLYDRQEVFVWSNCLLDLGTDFLVGNMHGLCMRCVVSASSPVNHRGLYQGYEMRSIKLLQHPEDRVILSS